MKNKLIYLPIGILTGVTVMSAATLLNSGANAAITKSAALSVKVNAACNFYNSADATPTAQTANNSTAKEFANANTLTAVCNDSTGVKIQAIGYSDDTSGKAVEGQTVMRNSTSTGLTIATGAIGSTCSSSATSAWGFKLTSVDNSYDATVVSAYSSYAAVPSSWTKVASYSGATSTTSGTAVKTSYCVRVGSTQAAGSYTGRVKYRVEQGAA